MNILNIKKLKNTKYLKRRRHHQILSNIRSLNGNRDLIIIEKKCQHTITIISMHV